VKLIPVNGVPGCTRIFRKRALYELSELLHSTKASFKEEKQNVRPEFRNHASFSETITAFEYDKLTLGLKSYIFKGAIPTFLSL
jgi:hypothetical protein